MLVAVALAIAAWTGVEPAEAARRRAIRCCIQVPDDDGGQRPYCFILNVRPARHARRVCRAISGTPFRTAAR
jgi:hypothetical protein